MAKHTFTWEDGKTFEFEDFVVNPQHTMAVYLPSNKRANDTVYGSIYVDAATAAHRNNQPRYNASPNEVANYKKEGEKIRVGVLAHRVSNGMPAGIYIPFKLVNRAVELLLTGLTGDFIFNEGIKKEEAVEVS